MTETCAPEYSREAPPEPPVSYKEFLAWADEDVHAEWINGEIQTMPPASAPHQRVVQFLSRILGTWVEERDAGEVFVAPFQVKLEERPSGREPDILVVTDEHRDRIHETHVGGLPIWS
jgi:Uma2 family endonuclease